MAEIKHQTHHDATDGAGIRTGRTSGRGEVKANFRTLIDLFGQPEPMAFEPKIDWMFVIYIIDNPKLEIRLEAGEIQCFDMHYLGKVADNERNAAKAQNKPQKLPPPSQIITIYNWKNGPGYGFPLDPYDLTEWHIGGNYSNSIEIIEALVEAAEKERNSDA